MPIDKSENPAYINSLLEVLSKIEGRDYVRFDYIQNSCGEFWADVFDELCKNRIVEKPIGDIVMIYNNYIPALKSAYEHKLDEIKKNDDSRKAATACNKAYTQDLKRTKIVSWVALTLSILAFILELIKLIRCL